MIKNYNKVDIYEIWMNSALIILSQKFQIKIMPNEPDEQRAISESFHLNWRSNYKDLIGDLTTKI